MIRFTQVSKSFGTRCVLQDLDLEIRKGELTFIIGKSGEGKSVTIKHMMGLLKPDSGQIYVEDTDITQLDDAALQQVRKKFGILFQHAALFDSMTVEENIQFPLREHTNLTEAQIDHRVSEVLDQVDLPHSHKKYPDALSTGEKKRVGLARALAAKPQILLYDEPTTGMDPLISEMIDELIVRVNQMEKDITSIVISHDLKAALATADRIIMLYQGRVELAGPPSVFTKAASPVVRQFFSGSVEGPMEFL